jgi:hypothetical protein
VLKYVGSPVPETHPKDPVLALILIPRTFLFRSQLEKQRSSRYLKQRVFNAGNWLYRQQNTRETKSKMQVQISSTRRDNARGWKDKAERKSL